MGKAVTGIFGSGKTGKYGYEKEILNYLDNYNTTNVDNTLNNLTSYANTASQDLSNKMGNYTFNVEASDDARKRVEDAVYQAYTDKLNPQYQNQRSDLETRLANQGLAVGSEAYQRAIKDLEDNQNNALNQAAYQSVLSGQNAYSNSLNDQINAGSFNNEAQQAYIQQLLSALTGSGSGYENAMNKYAVQSGVKSRQDQTASSGWANIGTLGGSAVKAFMSSDRRLKENIRPVGKLHNGLTVYCFNYCGQATPQIGLIAQEVQQVIPEAVMKNKDGYLMVNYELATKD